MTDAPGSAPAPKKRSFFKKAAWQKSAQAETEKEHDLFSHSNEFRDIVAEETKRKNEERKKEEESRRRKVDDVRERKRRKVSLETDEPKMPGSGPGSGSSARSRVESKARSRTPLSPIRNEPPKDSLSARYDSLTKSSSSVPAARKDNDVIELGSSDSEHSLDIHLPGERSIPPLPSKRAASEEIDEVEDPALAAIAAQARARAADSSQGIISRSNKPDKVAVVQLLITSYIPNTSPLLIKIKTDTTVKKPKEAWCGKQNFSPAMTSSIFLTWKGNKLFDSTTIQRLGIKIDVNGCVSVDGDSNIYDESNLPKIHLEAWTKETFEQQKREEAAEAATKKKAAEPPPVAEEREPTLPSESEAQKIRLFLKAKGKEDFKICVNPDTTFGHLANAYKMRFELPKEQPITLTFDGERLKPMDTVVDAEIEDMDSIDVVFK